MEQTNNKQNDSAISINDMNIKSLMMLRFKLNKIQNLPKEISINIDINYKGYRFYDLSAYIDARISDFFYNKTEEAYKKNIGSVYISEAGDQIIKITGNNTFRNPTFNEQDYPEFQNFFFEAFYKDEEEDIWFFDSSFIKLHDCIDRNISDRDKFFKQWYSDYPKETLVNNFEDLGFAIGQDDNFYYMGMSRNEFYTLFKKMKDDSFWNEVKSKAIY